jgi:hypothetical protein
MCVHIYVCVYMCVCMCMCVIHKSHQFWRAVVDEIMQIKCLVQCWAHDSCSTNISCCFHYCPLSEAMTCVLSLTVSSR